MWPLFPLFPGSAWSTAFFGTVLVTGFAVLAFLGAIFSAFEQDIVPGSPQNGESRTIPTYLALFIFGELYLIVLTYNGLRNKNTNQILWICVLTMGFCVYAGVQYDQIRNALLDLHSQNYYSLNNFGRVKALAIALPCVLGVSLLAMSAMAYKLHQEFGWSLYKYVGADISLKRRYSSYLTLVTLLKFDFFFFLGFAIQFLVLVLEVHNYEFGITIAVIPITILILVATYHFVRHERLLGMTSSILFFLAGVAYFVFKLVRMYEPDQSWKYAATRKTLTGFAVVTLVLIVLTIVYSGICVHNFGTGLKQVVLGTTQNIDHTSKYELDGGYVPTPMEQAKPVSRMTIE